MLRKGYYSASTSTLEDAARRPSAKRRPSSALHRAITVHCRRLHVINFVKLEMPVALSLLAGGTVLRLFFTMSCIHTVLTLRNNNGTEAAANGPRIMGTQSNTHRFCQGHRYCSHRSSSFSSSSSLPPTASFATCSYSFCHKADVKCHLPWHHHQAGSERFKGSGKADKVAEVKLLHGVARGTQVLDTSFFRR